MLKVYRITNRIFTRLSKKPRLLKCYDCAKRLDAGSLVVSTTYGNSFKLRCPECAAKYGIMARKEINELSDKNLDD